MQTHRLASPVRFHDKRPLSLKLLQYLFIGHYFFPSAFPLCGFAEIISPCTLASSEPLPVHPRQAVAPPLSGHHEETGHLLIIRTSPQKSFIPLICYGSPSVIWSRPCPLRDVCAVYGTESACYYCKPALTCPYQKISLAPQAQSELAMACDTKARYTPR